MKSIMRTILVGGLAMLALSGLAAASASAALPEFKPIPTKKKFTATGGVIFVWSSAEDGNFECTASSSTGEVTGAKTLGNVVIKWTGCKMNSSIRGTCPVSSEGAKSGEILSKTLTGELGTVATGEAKSGVGLLLKPAKGTGWTVLEGTCISEGFVSGTAVSEVTPIGKKQATYSFLNNPKIKEITLDSGTIAKPHLSFIAGSFEIGNEEALLGKTTFEEALEVT